MKKQLLITSLLAMVATGAFAQGTVSFKTSITKDPVFFTTDNATDTLTLVATDGTAGSFGSVNYEIYAAPTGTPLGALNASGQPGSAWTGVAVGPVAYTAPGVVSPGITVTLPVGTAGAAEQIEIYAYTGTLANPTAFGYTGESISGGTSFVYQGTTYFTGASGWTQATGNPNPPTPTQPATLTTGSAADGALVLTSTPEPSTIALGGLGAAALLLFRRRK
jgi:PEP-CTERM motif